MKSRSLVCLSLIALLGAVATPVFAQEEESPFSGNVALTSNYTFRGLTQTNGKPAIQGGFDYANPNGFYIGTWASNVSWLSDLGDISNSVEIDVYAGFSGTWGEAVNYDFGVIYYAYPGDYPGGFVDPDTIEGYFSIGYSIATLKYSHAFTDFFGIDGGAGSGYLDLSVSQGFAETWTFDAHVGRQWVDGASALDYTDWSLGVSKDLGNGFAVAVAYVDTNAERDLYTNPYGKYVGKATGIVTLSKSL